jgi:hypothetical protein
MLLFAGAALCGYLGYRLLGWWVPAAVAGVVLAVQALVFRATLAQGGYGEALALGAAMSVVMFYAAFSIGRSLGERRARRRKGAR